MDGGWGVGGERVERDRGREGGRDAGVLGAPGLEFPKTIVIV